MKKLLACAPLLLLLLQCSKEKKAPIIETSRIEIFNDTNVIAGGVMYFDGNDEITEKGVCWTEQERDPVISDAHKKAGSGPASFTLVIDLDDNTVYHFRAYARNSTGTSYGKKFTIAIPLYIPPPPPPPPPPGPLAGISTATAPPVVTGNKLNTGGVITVAATTPPVIQAGICWSSTKTPNILDNRITTTVTSGPFTVEMKSLSSDQVYYVRAFATNSTGTAYGQLVTFMTSPENMIDNDGNEYPTVRIGSQVWTAQNYAGISYQDFTPLVASNSSTWNPSDARGLYCAYDNDPNNAATYGLIYSYSSVANSRKLAPPGWHVPTAAEWSTLIAELGGHSNAGNKLKIEGAEFWNASPNANNSSGMSVMPGGMRNPNGTYSGMQSRAYYWSSTYQTGAYVLTIYDGSTASVISASSLNNTSGYYLRLIRD